MFSAGKVKRCTVSFHRLSRRIPRPLRSGRKPTLLSTNHVRARPTLPHPIYSFEYLSLQYEVWRLFGTSKSNSTFPRTTTMSLMRRSSSSNNRRNTSQTTDRATTPTKSRMRKIRSTTRRILTFVKNSLSSIQPRTKRLQPCINGTRELQRPHYRRR